MKPSSNIDFAELHNVARNLIYMREAVDAAVIVVEEALTVHESKLPVPAAASYAYTETQNCLRYRLHTYKSLQGKVNSEEKRMSNTINLVCPISSSPLCGSRS